MIALQPTRLEAAEFSLRLLASRGAPAYFVYLVEPPNVSKAIEELREEISAFDHAVEIDIVDSTVSSAQLLQLLSQMAKKVLLIDAQAYTEMDWTLLDRRRSALAREATTVFLTATQSFAVLMRVAPNLASWLGGFVFLRESSRERIERRREQRLAALRSWSGQTDDEIVREAANGSLPRDPQYGEWLTLLGRGDLLDA